MKRLLLLLLAALCPALEAAAHEVRPAYLELSAAGEGVWEITWKLPVLAGRVPALQPVLPESCRPVEPRRVLRRAGSAVERWRVECGPGGLESGTVAIAGLESTLVDVLVRLRGESGEVRTTLLRRGEASMALGEAKPRENLFLGYLRLGVEHIAGGFDHLLFVAALVLLLGAGRRLILAVTAFTAAHSVTLALATLGFVHVPGAPVEAVIALSLLFLATELVRARRAEAPQEATLTSSRPWIVTLSFGLLHGFGFAGALAQVGLPAEAIPRALLAFNLGVEVGQLLFVGALLLLGAALRRAASFLPASIAGGPRWPAFLPDYAIGTAAVFWLCQRLAGF